MTLKKFALWLGEQVNDPKNNISAPRLLLYIEDRTESNLSSQSSKDKSNFNPDIDETFKPTGAITTLFGDNMNSQSTVEPSSTVEKKYCINCGTILKQSSKFCKICGTIQE